MQADPKSFAGILKIGRVMELDNLTTQANEATKADPWETISYHRAIFAFACILLSYSIFYVDRALVTNIMPRVAGQLNGINLYSWVFTVNMLIATCMAPIWGKLSDTYGRRNIFLTMLGIIVVGLILCAASPSFIVLIAARGIVGIGTGGLQAVTFAIIADLFAPAKRGKYSGFTVVMTAIASTFIPVLAGWITDAFGWRWSFILPIPLALLALILVYFVVPNICSEKKAKMDYLGSLLLAAASVPLLLAFSWAGSLYKWGTPVNIGLIGFSLVMFVVFYRHECQIPYALVSPRLLKNRNFMTAAMVSTFMAFGLMAGIIYIPLFTQAVLGLSATMHGVVAGPAAAIPAVSGIIGGWLMSKTKRYKWLLILGPASSVVALLIVSQLQPGINLLLLAAILCIQWIFGGYMPAVNPIAALNGLKPEESGQAAGTLYYFASLGFALAPSLLGSVMNSTFTSTFNAKLTPVLASSLTATQLATLHNPRILVDAAAMRTLENSFAAIGPQGPDLFKQSVEVVHSSMQQGLQSVFITAALLVCISVAFAISIKELPMPDKIPGRNR